jgi:hypothetical protein
VYYLQFQSLGFKIGILYHLVLTEYMGDRHEILVRSCYPAGMHWFDNVPFQLLAARKSNFYPQLWANPGLWKSPEYSAMESVVPVEPIDLPLFVSWTQLSAEFQRMLTSTGN